ncbi:MAG: protein-glutamate O-methyltransferase CheR [Myxococcota bacterium]
MTVAATDFAVIRDLVEARSGIVLEAGKEYLAEARLTPIVDRHHLGTLGELVRRLHGPAADRLLQRQVVDALTTNETSFFRDVVPFQVLKTVVFPAIGARPAADRRLRLWSAACSSGQEAYSVAMMLKDEFPSLFGDARIVGTDINEAMTTKARSGRYSQLEVNRGLPAPALLKHFQRVGTEWEVASALRGITEFQTMNLLERWPYFAPFDVVLLRNVLIYFSPATKGRLLERIKAAIRPGGWLMLGASEAGSVPSALFDREQHGPVTLFRPRP